MWSRLRDCLCYVRNTFSIWVLTQIKKHFHTNHTNVFTHTNNLKQNHSLLVYHVLDVMNFGDEERDAYESHLKWLRIEANTLRKYEAKGFEEGMEKGIEKGREEEKVKIASSLLKMGLDIRSISESTGLSIEEV